MLLLFVRIFSFLLARLPEAVNRALAAAVGALVFAVLRKRRRALLSNLSHAFPEKPHAWIERMARESCRQMIETGMLAIAIPQLSRERLTRMLRLAPGASDRLERLVAERRPIVACVPHLGAWELAAALPLAYGKPLPTLADFYRPLNDAALDGWVRTSRERFGVRLLSRKSGFSEGMRLLKAGGIQVVFFDQNAGDLGELTLFFDRVCSSTNLHGLLREKFDARLICGYVRRTAFWRYSVEVVLPEDAPTAVDEVTRFADRWLENLLRSDEELCPSWLWIHNRWKTQVAPERRFRLEQKRMLVPAAGPLPRRTRFVVRLPESAAGLQAALPFVRDLRRSRPDAAITAIAPAGFAPGLEAGGLFEKTVPLPAGSLASLTLARRLGREYPDCWVILSGSRRADLEAWLARCPQRFGIALPGGRRRRLLTHTWQAPAGLAAAADPARLFEGFFRHFGGRDIEPGPTPAPKS